MIKNLKAFFYPPVLTYRYNQPKEFVIAKITDILKQKVSIHTSNDMIGRFLNHNTFAINIISFAYTRGVKYGSTLVGQIIESEKEITEIKTKAKPRFIYYFLFFTALIFGLIYFYKFIYTGSIKALFWSLTILILGPGLSIGISNVAIYSVQKRYKIYIDKALIT